MNKKQYIIWLAGFFDGEGCLYIRINPRGGIDFWVTFTQSRLRGKDVIYQIRDFYNNGYIYNGKYGASWKLTITKRDTVKKIIKDMFPYLKIKNQEAKLFLESIKNWEEKRIKPKKDWRGLPIFK